MDKSPNQEVDSRSVKFLEFMRPYVHYRVPCSPPLGPVLSSMKEVHYNKVLKPKLHIYTKIRINKFILLKSQCGLNNNMSIVYTCILT
jgi:hypothetical protein